MKILVRSIAEIANDRLSIVQRGLLITILILKDPDPKMTLAKLRVKVRLNDYRKDLIFLHQEKYIRWSGYKSAVKSLESTKISPDVVEIITFMNNLYKRKFDPNASNTELRNRLRDHDVEDIKKVVANRYAAWKDEPVMAVHLHPSTIFRKSKFDKYLEEVRRTRQGESFVQISELNIKSGDELTEDNVTTFIDSDLYSLRTYKIDKNGARIGSGVKSKRTGKALKSLVKIQFNKLERDGYREESYCYSGE